MIRVLSLLHPPTNNLSTDQTGKIHEYTHRSQRETDSWSTPAPFGALGLRAGGKELVGLEEKMGEKLGCPTVETCEKSPNYYNLGGWFKGDDG